MIRRIGLLGGTFDPVHFGHLSIARSFLNNGSIDKLWILATPNPPHKKEEALTPFKYRKQMLEAAFTGFEDVVINDIEQKLPAPNYTIRTLKALKEQFPEYTFYLCIGEDSLTDFETWRKPFEILQECELLVARRPNFDSSKVKEEILAKVRFIDHEPIEISSSELKERIKEGKDASEFIPESVLRVIKKYNLYK